MAAFALLASAVTPAMALHSGAAADSQLRMVGSMPFGFHYIAGTVIPPMVIDSTIHRGVIEVGGGFQIYDTADLRPLSFIDTQDAGGANQNSSLGSGILAAVDEDRHRIFFPGDVTAPGCSSTQLIHTLDLISNSWSSAAVPCYQNGSDGFVADGISYYGPTKKLYVVGMSSTEYQEAAIGTNNVHESTIVRELDPNSSPPFAVNWEVDAGSACDFHMGAPSSHTGVVARVGDKVLVYCYRGKQFGQGEVAVIPLSSGRPSGSGVTSLPVVSAGPGGSVRMDPQTGRVLITMVPPPYGPATWVYDTLQERFIGVVPLGVPGQFLSGFDPSLGRLYFHDKRGFVLTDTRQDPLPGGVSYDTLHDDSLAKEAFNVPLLAVDSGLHRIFVPDHTHTTWKIVQDDVAVVAGCANGADSCTDPDAGTADIAEQSGKTDRAFSGGANAFGVHLLNTSGVPGAIQNVGDPGNVLAEGVIDCYLTPSNCVSTTLISPGDREGFLAQTSLAQGSALGSTAFASSGRVSPKDHATDSDVRELGVCQSDRVGAVSGSDPARKAIADQCHTPAPLKDAVDQSPLAPLTPENLRQGTARSDGNQFPINGSLCVDFGGHPLTQNSAEPSTLQGYSTVSCDASTQATSASAELAAVGLPQVPNPTVSIAHASSQTTSQLTNEGLLTTASATATGVNIGGQFSIGRVYTQAITKAHGRSGTTHADFTRLISDVHGPGIDCAATCDPQQVVNAINQAFAGHLSVVMAPPERLATPHGYTAVIAKDPGQRNVDQLLNDDDTLTFDGLDVVLINDNSYGSLDRVTFDSAGNPQFQPGAPPGGNRSRLLVGLAGIQAESHYGVFPLVQGGGGGGGTSAEPGTPGTPDGLGTPGTEYVIPPNIARGEGIIGIPGYRLAASSGTPAQVKHNHPGLVSRLLHGLLRPFKEALKKFWALIINHPVEAVLVFLILSLLAIPLYLGYRRRQLARALAA